MHQKHYANQLIDMLKTDMYDHEDEVFLETLKVLSGLIDRVLGSVLMSQR